MWKHPWGFCNTFGFTKVVRCLLLLDVNPWEIQAALAGFATWAEAFFLSYRQPSRDAAIKIEPRTSQYIGR